tara:strand:- start:5504 stop:5995 length:492 start_codon:yes stop_codon:yes gene_type:complete
MNQQFIFWIFLVVLLDLFVKHAIEIFDWGIKPISIFHHLIISKTYNKGLFFGIAHSDSIIVNYSLILLMTLVILILIFYISKLLSEKKCMSRLSKISWIMLLGGGIANYIDRVIDNKVTDYIILHYHEYYFPGIFNIADVFISLAFILIVIDTLFTNEKEDRI